MAVTLSSLRDQSRQRADMVNSEFCTDTEVNGYINNSIAELYDLLVSAYEDQYVCLTPQTITLVSGTDTYDLASDFYKLLGVDLYINGEWVTLKPFTWAERNLYQRISLHRPYRYRLQGNKLRFVPVPDNSDSLRVWYVPRFTALAADSDTFDGINGWEEYVIVDTAIKMLQKEESDASVLMAQKEALRQRVLAMASNRDEGAPGRISDVDLLEYDPFFRRMP